MPTIAETAIAALKTQLDTLTVSPGGVIVEQDRETEFSPAELPAINMVIGDDDEVDRANGILRRQVTIALEIYVDATTTEALSGLAGEWAGRVWQKAVAARAAAPEIWEVFHRGVNRVLPDEDNAKPHLFSAVTVDLEYHVDPDDPFSQPS